MKTQTLSLGHGWRGSETTWLDAAYQALITGGVDAVKIMPLAQSLRLSRTSFYYHFTDREALLDALIHMWQNKNTGNLVRQTERPADDIVEAVLNLFDCWITPALFDAHLEFAMRNWARTNPALQSVFKDTDLTRIAAIRDMFIRHGYDAQQADIRANTIYLTQVGYIAIGSTETLAERIDRIPTYVETFTGRAPDPATLRAFVTRHQAKASAETGTP
ncbi:TetR/AcrR family transcriptional regulator [Pseudogemmobacter sp. W21_MBD1_M6]|uniref:TetR/AcrR family transcriptional regulator n=1 Tax=Pseudogemmobacter sp. W21_MBD1_M6 TaxID=3240271 RepID=UPI003F9B34FA